MRALRPDCALNTCCSECAGRVSLPIQHHWRRIAERFRWMS